MAGIRITALPIATSFNPGDWLVGVVGNVTSKIGKDLVLSGTSGTSGTDGSSGESGTSGSSGSSGSSGTSGTHGTSGSSGSSGVSAKYRGFINGSINLSTLVVGNQITMVADHSLEYSPGQNLIVARDDFNHFHGEIVSYNPNGTLVMKVNEKIGTGTYNQWTVNLDGRTGAQGAQGAQGVHGAQGSVGPGVTINSPSANAILTSNSDGSVAEANPNLRFDGNTLIINPEFYTPLGDNTFKIITHEDGTSGTAGILVRQGLPGQPWEGYVENHVPDGYQHQFLVGNIWKAHIDEYGVHSQADLSVDGEIYLSGITQGPALDKYLVWDPNPFNPGDPTGKVYWKQGAPNGSSGTSGSSGSSGSSFLSPYTGNIQVNGQAWANSYTASSATIDWDNGNVQFYTLTGATTFTFNDGKAGGTYILVVKQGAAGGYTVGWPGSVTWASTPTMTAGANKYDVYTFVYVDSKYFGSYLQNFS
jgi:hypothetical protein